MPLAHLGSRSGRLRPSRAATRAKISDANLPASGADADGAGAGAAASGNGGGRGRRGARGTRATLDLGVLAAGLPAEAGVGDSAADGALGGGRKKVSWRERLFGAGSRKREEKKEAKEEKLRASRHGGAALGASEKNGGQILGAAAAAAATAAAAGGAAKGDPVTSAPSARDRASAAPGGSSRASGKVGAASSLGSLQGYAQTTVKDGGPLNSCFRNSTSEVDRVRRFARPPSSSGALGDPTEEKASKKSSVEEAWGRGSSGGRRGFSAADAAASATPEGSDGADGVEDELVFSEEQRKNGSLSKRPKAFEYPTFALAEYGAPQTWNSDVFVLVHNATRWEIMDLYTIIGSLNRRWFTLTMRDLFDFADFWEVFELFVAQSFEVEDQIVFPYMLGQAASSEKLERYYNSAKYSKEKLVGMLYDIGLTIEKLNTSPAGEVFPTLYNRVLEFLPAMLEYMQTQDTVLPEVFASHCDPEDRIMLNRAVANFLIRAAHGRDAIAILTRWIEDTMILQIWKDENLSARAKSSHAKWVKKLEANHTAIARRFQRRLRSGNPSQQLKGSVGSIPQPGNPSGVPDRSDPSVVDRTGRLHSPQPVQV